MQLLFKTQEELKSYLPSTTSAFLLAHIEVFLMRAQNGRVKDALGHAQLAELATAYASDTLTDAQKALLSVVRVPLGNFGAQLYLPHSGVQLSGSGAKQSGSNEMKPASPAALARLSAELRDAGNEGIEAMLEFLEENRADYPTWATSDACTVLHGEFIGTAKEFDRYVYIDRSRQRFLELQPAIRDVVTLSITPLIGRAQLNELRAQLAAGTVTDANKELLDHIKPTIASLAIRDDETRQEIGQAYYEELHQFLYENALSYPLFTESKAYKPEVSTQLTQNTDWGFYAAL